MELDSSGGGPATLVTALFSNCNFTAWDVAKAAQPAFKLIGGGGGSLSTVKVSDSNFRQDDPQADVSGAIKFSMTDNVIAGTLRITSTATHPYQAIDNTTFNAAVSYAIFANLDTTPSVSASETYVEANTGATTIALFDDMQDGQTRRILFTTANTTIQDNVNVQLAGGANFVGTANDVLVIAKIGSTIYEMSRSMN